MNRPMKTSGRPTWHTLKYWIETHTLTPADSTVHEDAVSLGDRP